MIDRRITATKVMCLFLVVFQLSMLISCKKKLKPIQVDPAFASYVISFSSGVLSSSSSIQVRLVDEIPGAIAGKTLSSNPFSISPGLEGEARWVDKQTIQFIPEKPLQSGEIYTVDFHLSQFVKVPDNMKTLRFRFQVKRQAVSYEFNGMYPLREDDKRWQKIQGILRTADYADPRMLEKSVQVSSKMSEHYRMYWKHSADGQQHEFTIDSVERINQEYDIKIRWMSGQIGAEADGSAIFTMPDVHTFKVLEVRTRTNPKTQIDVFFSDPLSKMQDMNGLFELKPSSVGNYMINGTRLNILPAEGVSGKENLIIYGDIKNIFETKMGRTYSRTLEFADLKPQIELMGEGVIVPHTNGILFPFRAVSLSAVDVKIIRIFENNIVQFLQKNQLNGSSQIKQVGRVVYNQEVALTSDHVINYRNWNNFSLDLSRLIDPEPGAIYRVELSFRKKHSLYPLRSKKSESSYQSEEQDPNQRYNQPEDSWGYYEDESVYDDADYKWEERDDPSSDSYYMGSEHKVTRNVLASDYGLIAKSGENNEYYVSVTDLRTTDPLKDVDIEFRNLQNQVMGVTRTNSEGMCRMKLNEKPFVLIARKDKQRGYMRLDDASSLSLSMFDIKGEELKKGVKGFLYGERGVWRPGDLMYLTFILEDKNNSLPVNHPAVLELYNPMGQLFQRVVRTNNENGFYSFIVKTLASSPTGNWTAKVRVGGSVFARTLRIETVKPNRMKIDLGFNTTLLHRGITEEGKVKVNWLYGAPASNTAVKIEASAASTQTVFESCKGYSFDDPTRKFTAEDIEIFQGKVNKDGEASIKCHFDFAGEAPGMIAVQMKTRAFEAGGNFSIDRKVFNYSPYKHYAGIKVPEGKGWNKALYCDEKNIFPIALVDENGRPVSGKVKIEVYNIYWRWWWDQSAEENIANFVSNQHSNLLKTDYLEIGKSGRGMYEMLLGGEFFGRKFIKVTDLNGGHSSGAIFYSTYKGWWSNAGSENPGGAEMLMFQTDKKSYRVGEKVSVELPVTHQGRALVSIESGSRVIRNFWFRPQLSNPRFQFETTPDMAPNIYIHVSYIQPHNHSKNDFPIRMYGVQSVEVTDPSTHLSPQIQMKSELKPLEKFHVSIKEAHGKPMTCTVAIVDEGLLDLTRYSTPDPWTNFYSHEALGVRTWDIYNYVAGAFTGKLSGLYAIGGDEYLNRKGKENNNRFKPVVLYQTALSWKANQTRVIGFTMPNYVGSVRVMVVAGNKGAYGNAEKTVAVKQSLMVLATVPRVISPTETMKIPVTVFATDKSVRDVRVQLSCDPVFKCIDNNSRQIRFAKPGDQVVEFTVKASAGISSGNIRVTAISGGNKASSITNLQIRMPNAVQSRSQTWTIGPGKQMNTRIDAIGIQGTNRAKVEISSFYPINIEKRMQYLIQYPHGCIEQISSAAFPQLYLSQLMEMSQAERTEAETNVKSALTRLKSYQLSSGGFAYWPEYNKEVSEWGTNYAGHFMLEAQSKGYQLPVGLFQPWLSYQTNKANNWQPTGNNYGSDMIQAYRLYTLALAHRPALSAMNRMREAGRIDDQAKWRLAAAYALSGKPEIAMQLIHELNMKITKSANYTDTYGSVERDKAMIAETLILLKQTGKVRSMIEDLSATLRSDEWLSTQSTAYTLLAISKYAGISSGAGLRCSAVMSGKHYNINSSRMLAGLRADMTSGKTVKLNVSNPTDKNIYLTITNSGVPVMERQAAYSENLKLSVRYFDMKDRPINPKQLHQGTDFYAQVTITHPGSRMNYQYLALEQLFPSGWEIMNSHLDIVQNTRLKSNQDSYQDIRDDRVYQYFDLEKSKSKSFRVLLHAAYAGTYYLPSVKCACMYDNSIQAHSEGDWVRVVK